MNENINENRNDEILTNEELEVMNNNLKNVENVTLPESLAPEKIAEKLENHIGLVLLLREKFTLGLLLIAVVISLIPAAVIFPLLCSSSVFNKEV